MRTLNLGILAHVDAGKTTLTERLLFTAGAIDHVGSVDAGTTQTDSLDLERERGITIRSAVASFLVGDLAVNLVDTPGHPDFIAEVERVLGVLDGAVLVVSAVEGVQPQTPLLFRALQRLGVPTLIFVNKVDRAGADPDARRRGDGAPAVAGGRPDGRASATRSRDATVVPFTRTTTPSDGPDARSSPSTTRRSSRAFVGDDDAHRRTRGCARRSAVQTRRGLVHPVFFGSAASGIGIDELLAGIDELLAGIERRPGRDRLGPRLQDRADRLPASASPTSACSPARCGRASASVSGAARRRRRRRSRSSRRPARRGATSSRRRDGDGPRPRRGPCRRCDRRAAAGGEA